MKKRNCRKSDVEKMQHERAIRIRKMTDAQLCEYLDGLKEKITLSFLDAITIRKEDGIRVCDATVRKLRNIAERDGFIETHCSEAEE